MVVPRCAPKLKTHRLCVYLGRFRDSLGSHDTLTLRGFTAQSAPEQKDNIVRRY